MLNFFMWFKINKNILVTLCLMLIYFFVFTIVLNDLNALFYIFPISLLAILAKLTWNVNNQILSSVILFVVLFMTVTMFNCSYRTKTQRDLHLLYNLYQMKRISSVPVMNITYQTPTTRYNMFFIETNYKRAELTTRELCAVESAARNNPNANVYLLSIRASLGSFSALTDRYPNLSLQKFMPFDLFNNTPLLNWFNEGHVFKSKYTISHLTDAARFTLLLKHGGVYSDLDTITLKSFDNLTKYNGAGYLYEDGRHSLGAGVLHFRANHPFLKFLVTKLALQYDPKVWGSAGPLMLIAALKEYCQTEDIFNELALEPLDYAQARVLEKRSVTSKTDSTHKSSTHLISNSTQTTERTAKCDDLTVLPQRYFYPYNYRQDLKGLFEKNSFIEIQRLVDTYSLHLYGKFSSGYQVKPGDSSIYDFLASTHCPCIYESVKANGLDFE